MKLRAMLMIKLLMGGVSVGACLRTWDGQRFVASHWNQLYQKVFEMDGWMDGWMIRM